VWRRTGGEDEDDERAWPHRRRAKRPSSSSLKIDCFDKAFFLLFKRETGKVVTFQSSSSPNVNNAAPSSSSRMLTCCRREDGAVQLTIVGRPI
jgi:hypothetical protein